MEPNANFSTKTPQPGPPLWRRFLSRPSTRLGKLSVGLALLFVLLILINGAVFMQLSEDVPWRQTILPFYGIAMMAIGLAAGIVAVIALRWRQERSWLVWIPLLAGLFLLV